MAPKYGVVEFGERLFLTADLDPVYVALKDTLWPDDQLMRWLVAYWSFYNCGVASYASQAHGADFWEIMLKAAENKTPAPTGGRWPRGPERRHFRGDAAVFAVDDLMAEYGNKPEDMVIKLLDGRRTVTAIIARVKRHYMFGNWIGFKAADMLDALFTEVDQSDISVFLYDTPRNSILENIAEGVIPIPEKYKFNERAMLEHGMNWLLAQLSKLRIPHKPRCPPDWFALETVYCKHLSHKHGHYPLLKDTREIHEDIVHWTPVCAAAGQFRDRFPGLPR